MKDSLNLLLLLLFHSSVAQKCGDFTIGSCQNDDLIWDNEVADAAFCQQFCHLQQDCIFFNYYEGRCRLYSDITNSNCAVIAGAPDQSVEDCILGAISDVGCDSFVYEECQYHGADTGFDPPAGQVVDPKGCEDFCRAIQAMDEDLCAYWVFDATNSSCVLLDSKDKTCWGLTGPKDPVIDTCISCSDELYDFLSTSTVDLQPDDYPCNFTASWNLTAGESGKEVWRNDNYCSGIAVSDDSYQDVEFKGSFVPLNGDDDTIGFFFGYQDSGHFYLVLAGNHSEDLSPQVYNWRLTKVSSATAETTFDMSAAIASGSDVPGQTEVLHTPEVGGWKLGSAYSWRVKHQPTINSLKVEVMEDGILLWRHVLDGTFQEPQNVGKVGVYTSSQPTRFYDLSVTKLCSFV